MSIRDDDFDAIRTGVRVAWPNHALNHGRRIPVPPVRDGGNTAALIDLAVGTALDFMHLQYAVVDLPEIEPGAVRVVGASGVAFGGPAFVTVQVPNDMVTGHSKRTLNKPESLRDLAAALLAAAKHAEVES